MTDIGKCGTEITAKWQEKLRVKAHIFGFGFQNFGPSKYYALYFKTASIILKKFPLASTYFRLRACSKRRNFQKLTLKILFVAKNCKKGQSGWGLFLRPVFFLYFSHTFSQKKLYNFFSI